MASPTGKDCALDQHNMPVLVSAGRNPCELPGIIHRITKACEEVSKLEELEARTSTVHAAVGAAILAKHMHRVAVYDQVAGMPKSIWKSTMILF